MRVSLKPKIAGPMDIATVARLANVSTATVSRVINGSTKVRKDTAERVKFVVAQTGYVPNRSARSLRVRHSKLFGLIVSDVRNPFFPDLIDGFEAMAGEHGIDVIFAHTNYDEQRLAHCLRRMVERNVDGIAVLTSEMNLEALEAVSRLKIPVVLLDQPSTMNHFSNVLTDFNSGFTHAVRYLQRLGHREIGFIGGPEGFESVRRRHEAFLLAMRSLHLEIRMKWIVPGDLHVDGGRSAMEEILGMAQRPTAVVTTNDLMAVGALQAAQQAGVSVPRDLSIIGFDDLPIAAWVSPPLTTICMSRQEIAKRAFASLLNASPVNHTPLSFKRSIHPRLIIRGSTAKRP